MIFSLEPSAFLIGLLSSLLLPNFVLSQVKSAILVGIRVIKDLGLLGHKLGIEATTEEAAKVLLVKDLLLVRQGSALGRSSGCALFPGNP